MAFYFFLWTEEIIDHLDQHGISVEEFERTVCWPEEIRKSRSSGKPIEIGYSDDKKHLYCVYELTDHNTTVIPITAYILGD